MLHLVISIGMAVRISIEAAEQEVAALRARSTQPTAPATARQLALSDFYPSPAEPPIDPYACQPAELAGRLDRNRRVRGSPEEQRLIDAVFAHYRAGGFPYPCWSVDSLRNALDQVRRASSCVNGSAIVRSPVGSGVVSAFHRDMWSVGGRDRRSAVVAFCDDDTFRKTLTNQVRLGSRLGPSNVRSAVQIWGGCAVISNFRPTAAYSLYKLFDARRVVDFCAGWGGRLFGAVAAGVEYVGIDPHTAAIRANRLLVEQLRCIAPDAASRVDLVWGCAEDILGRRLWRPDLVLTSPPYFDTERYSPELTQSYLRFPTEDDWYDNFLGACIRGAAEDLVVKGRLALNVNHAMVARTARLALAAGLRMERTLDLVMSSRTKGRAVRSEPVLVFQKP